jgi:RNA polymerase sigma-70 factor (ECF subfamily)
MSQHQHEIIKQLRRGSHEAYRLVFDTYFTKVVYFAFEYVDEYETSREIAQDAFMKLWEKRHTLKPDANITSYLFTLAKNQALNYIKHRLIERRYANTKQHEELRQQINFKALSDPTHDIIQYIELNDKIKETIQDLPPRCREIFLLSRMEELKYREIAARLGISEKTVENQIAEALKRLRKALKKFL